MKKAYKTLHSTTGLLFYLIVFFLNTKHNSLSQFIVDLMLQYDIKTEEEYNAFIEKYDINGGIRYRLKQPNSVMVDIKTIEEVEYYALLPEVRVILFDWYLDEESLH